MISGIRHRLSALGLLCLLFTAAPAQGATPAQYDQALSEVQAMLDAQAHAVKSGHTLPTARTPAVIAVQLLLTIRSVQRPGGVPQPVDCRLLLHSLDVAGHAHTQQDRLRYMQAVEVQISELRAAVNGPISSETGRTGEAAESSARAVLAAPLYSSDPLPPPTWLDRTAARVGRWLDRLFHRRAPSAEPAPINPLFIKALLIALLAGVFAVLVWVLVRWLRSRGPGSRPLLDNETEEALVEARDSDSLYALAEQRAGAGDYRLALRYIYLALLVALDTDGVLRFDRSKTNWEYLRALRAEGRSDVYDAMAPLTREFDRIWYGFARADIHDYTRARDLFQALNTDTTRMPAMRT